MRFLISGCIQTQGFGLEPEPIRLVVEAANMEGHARLLGEFTQISNWSKRVLLRFLRFFEVA